ncbi:MAG TPA: hypothetical protein VHP11_06740 [Tepidisphaeraceae bacterium]|nr:hypothetical protein [Tepidisphaeraceae bacterium]
MSDHRKQPPQEPDRLARVDVPHRDPSLEADFFVPFFQTLATALLPGSGLAAVVCWLWATPIFATWLVCVSVCGGVGWLWRLGIISQTLWRVETYLDADLNGDGVKGDPGRNPSIMVVNPRNGQAALRQDDLAQLHIEFRQFILECRNDTTAGKWEKRLGRAKYQEFRNALISAGYARWNSDQDQRSGWRLAATPEQILLAIFGEAASLEALPMPEHELPRRGK